MAKDIKIKLNREELRTALLAWIHKYDVNYRIADKDHHGAGYTVDIDDLMAQIDYQPK